MNKLLFFLFPLLLVLTGCPKDKEKDPEPAKPAAAVAGTYTLSAFRYSDSDGTTNLPTLPTTINGRTVSGTVVLTQVSGQDAKVSLKLTLKITGQQDAVIDIDEIGVEGSGPYTLKLDGQSVGSVDGNTCTFSVSETDQQGQHVELSFTGRK
ncbi:hypothetical protein [Hymenobacter weizhouensis]|uniref:hypothetical protein n=1 Tax=Hymenobacter sp. YIM 151500-1 TaxID=2987689 RepID=UPI0022279B2F|nr:hypothetical protein [Hymenobacter sp. YIM 151500-1]UYZ63493.1 hypothetical protein OIS53_01310 [Hymenobacter sp. YIM 151500-1]